MVIITQYFRQDTILPSFISFPRFLIGMNISQTAKILYSLLLDRAKLSRKNGWIDSDGHIYIVYPIEHMVKDINRSHMTVKKALNELETEKLIERKRHGFSAPNHLYVMLPVDSMDGQKSVPMKAENLSITGQEKYPSERPKNILQGDRKSSSNQINRNQIHSNQSNAVNETFAFYGVYKNVHLTDNEFSELQKEIPDFLSLIDELSTYMQSSGKKYVDHAATLRLWASRQKQKKSAPNSYTYNEGESL